MGPGNYDPLPGAHYCFTAAFPQRIIRVGIGDSRSTRGVESVSPKNSRRIL